MRIPISILVRIPISILARTPISILMRTPISILMRIKMESCDGCRRSAHLTELAPSRSRCSTSTCSTSSDYGARKPDPAVFVRAMQRYDAEPADTFFADDLTENVAGATSVGITAHLYRDPAGLSAAVLDFVAPRTVEAGSR